MAEIRPFRGVRYDLQKIGDLSKVLCPPYDIISPQQQDELYRNSEYNFVRIEFNKESPQDNPQDNRYTRASANMANWLKQGILKQDKAPALYLHEHYFTCQGKKYQRLNILTCVRLEEWDKKIIRPHENIIPKAKSDRMSMLQYCQCNTSEVLAMYADPEKIIASTLAAQQKDTPLIDMVDTVGERHKIWAITQPEAIQKIQQAMASQPLYIADGHHRYDSALTYKRERAAKTTGYTGEESFNFVMISLMDFTDVGLVILPTHRLLRGFSESTLTELKSQLKTYFDIQNISINQKDAWQKVDALLTGMTPEMQQIRLAVFGLDGENISVLTLKNLKALSQFMPAERSDLYKKLDVSIVDHLILDNILKFDKDKVEGSLIYSHDRLESINRVKSHEYQMVFILNPVRPEVIKGIADVGDRMPRKSTYFYPKSPAGLVFYKW